MYELMVKGQISSAHFLNGYEGKCKYLHGHNWLIEAAVPGAKLDEVGMVADFAVLKKRLHNLLDGLDHVCLNDLPYFQDKNPTTENLARHIYEEYSALIKPLKVGWVRAWESEAACVTYTGE